MNKPEEPLRPLELDPARVMRADRPHYAIIDIGSNSVRLMVYDQLGRAPMPRFNEKSLCRLAEGLAQTGAIAPDGFRRTVEAARRFRAIAEAMGVGKARRDCDRGDATRVERAGAGECDLSGDRTRGSHPVGRRGSAIRDIGRDFRILSPGRNGRRHGRRQPRSGGGDRRPGRRTLGQPAARGVAGRGDARRRLFGGQATSRRDPSEQPESSAGAPGLLSRRRRLARARQGPHRNGRRSGQGRARLYAGSLGRARLCQIAVAALAGQTGRDAGRLGASGAHASGCGAGAGSGAETPCARSGSFSRRSACAKASSIRNSTRPSNISTRWSRARN